MGSLLLDAPGIEHDHTVSVEHLAQRLAVIEGELAATQEENRILRNAAIEPDRLRSTRTFRWTAPSERCTGSCIDILPRLSPGISSRRLVSDPRQVG